MRFKKNDYVVCTKHCKGIEVGKVYKIEKILWNPVYETYEDKKKDNVSDFKIYVQVGRETYDQSLFRKATKLEIFGKGGYKKVGKV